MKKTVMVNIVTARGHDVLEAEPVAALEAIKEQVKNGKMLYIDGNLTENIENVTIENIANAETLNMTNAIVGG